MLPTPSVPASARQREEKGDWRFLSDAVSVFCGLFDMIFVIGGLFGIIFVSSKLFDVIFVLAGLSFLFSLLNMERKTKTGRKTKRPIRIIK
jgi:uncharacterized membrane protein